MDGISSVRNKLSRFNLKLTCGNAFLTEHFVEIILWPTEILSGIILSKIIIFDRIFDRLIPDRYIFD